MAMMPFSYGRWDDTARAHVAADERHTNDEASAVYGSAGAYDPETTRAALAALTARYSSTRANSTQARLRNSPDAWSASSPRRSSRSSPEAATSLGSTTRSGSYGGSWPSSR